MSDHTAENVTLRTALVQALAVETEGHYAVWDKHGTRTESGWLSAVCACGEYAWPCPHVLKAQVDAVRAVLDSCPISPGKTEVRP